MTGSPPLPQGDEKHAAVQAMFDSIAPRYDLVNRIMTFGLDIRWRRRTVRELALPPAAIVADIACGTGDFCRDLAAAGLRPIGFDFSIGMLQAARTEAPLVQGDAVRLPLADRSVDGATCGFALRNFVDLGAFFDELARVVRPGGRVAFLEVGQPGGMVGKGYDVYFGRVVPAIGGLLSDRSAYRYLPRSVEYLPEPRELLHLLRARGYNRIDRSPLNGGIAQLITASVAGSTSGGQAETHNPIDNSTP